MDKQPAMLPVVGTTASILDVMMVIGEHAAGCVFVVDDEQRVAGTIDDRDLLHGILRGRGLDSPAAPLARPPAALVDQDARRADVLEMMQARGLATLPIVDEGGRLIGVHLREEVVGATELPNWAVIMAGGRGTRLKPLTDEIPKPMLPVAGRPILERLVLHLVGAGIRTIFLAVNYRREQIEQHFGNGSSFGCRIHYLREDPDQPLGTGGALSLLAERRWYPQHPVLVLNGDLLVDFSVRDLLASHNSRDVAATMAVHPHRYTVPYGVVEANGQGLVRLVEKPVASWLVNAGIYVLEPGLIGRIPRRKPYAITALFDECLAQGDHVQLWTVEDWLDIGQPAEFARARGLA